MRRCFRCLVELAHGRYCDDCRRWFSRWLGEAFREIYPDALHEPCGGGK